MDAKGIWNCEISAKGKTLTVGEKFTLVCTGEPISWDTAKLKLEAPKETPYALKILKVAEVSETKATFIATTYMAPEQGALNVQGFVLSDGTHQVSLAAFQLQSHSVITPENNPEKKPYGSLAPMKIAYPIELYLGLGLISVLFIALMANWIWRARQRKVFLSELEKRTTVLTAYNQFNKELRALSRLLVVTAENPWSSPKAQEFLNGLQEAFFWYLAREYRMPAQQWSQRQVLKAIRSHSVSQFKKFEKELRLALRELARAHQAAAQVNTPLAVVDATQLLELCRKAVEKIQKERS